MSEKHPEIKTRMMIAEWRMTANAKKLKINKSIIASNK